MTINAVIFDLDGTLVDTSAIQTLRDTRQWKACVSQVNTTQLFPGVRATLEALKTRGLKLAVCTSSVSFYAGNLLAHHQIEHFFDVVIAYHDTIRRKPAPDPILSALGHLAVNAAQAVGIGDHAVDVAALTAAGVLAMGAGWSPVLDRAAAWNQILPTPLDLLPAIEKL